MSAVILRSHSVAGWRDFWTIPTPEPRAEATRIRVLERDIGLPVKLVVVAGLFYYLFLYQWYPEQVTKIALQIVQRSFLAYVLINIVAASILLAMHQLPLHWLQRVVIGTCFVDGVFLAIVTLVTGGFGSALYWAFLGLIVRNTISVASPGTQILLNLSLTLSYLLAGLEDWSLVSADLPLVNANLPLVNAHLPLAKAYLPLLNANSATDAPEITSEPFMLRMVLFLLMAACCCGLRVLFEKQRRAEEEAREFAQCQQQLQAAGRLAVEIAHQLKNPLGIINTAAFTLQRTVKEGGKTITQQIRIIREEVTRSDRIITDLMGYARLVEGRLEKLDVLEELERAIVQVFPPAVKYETQIHREYAVALPVLFLQRNHLSEIFVNLLQNAREAMDGRGNITVRARFGEHYSVVVEFEDNGPGIAPDQVDKVFEPYYTTKENGTGLGLAIVRHNTEIYGGIVGVESELGKGAKFVLRFPARALMKLRK